MVRLKTRGRMTLAFLTLVILAVAVTSFIAIRGASSIIENDARDKLRIKMQVLQMTINDQFGGKWEMKNGELYCGGQKAADMLPFIDKMVGAMGGNISICAGDVRVATTVKMDDGKRAVGVKVEEEISRTVLRDRKDYLGITVIRGVPFFVMFSPLTDSSGNVIGMIAVNNSMAEVEAERRANIVNIGIVALILFLITAGLSVVLSRTVSRPVLLTASIIAEMAAGKFDVSVDRRLSERVDEFGEIARSLDALRNRLREVFQKIIMLADKVSAGSESVSGSSHEAAEASNQVAEAVTEIAGSIDRQSHAVADTSAVIEENSASLEQVAATANHVSASSAEMVEIASSGGKAAETAIAQMLSIQQAVDNLSAVINKLGEQSQSIGQIVNTIASISAQTNLLALNAAIEAARAGEQGRGFAVVAEEVRKLAEQSQEAAKQISSLIVEIQQDTERAVTAMRSGAQEVKTGAQVVDSAAAKFREIAGAITEVNSQMREISAAVEEMAAGSQRMVHAIKDVDAVSRNVALQAQSVSAATEETSASMEEIASASRSLSAIAAEMQEEVVSFAGALLLQGSKLDDDGRLRLTAGLKTNVGVFDGQHARLIDMINNLYDTLQRIKNNQQPPAVLRGILSELAQYATDHFGKEEEYMARYGYPDLDNHRQQHKYFADRVKAAMANFESAPYETADSVYRFLKGWLLAHIADVDKKYGPFLNSKGVK
ncbi:MAG: bacteriohemerythrin [Negativicutes bacterium]|nr:bacteriohemerythrin [Negativicutes bacterium]